jgi:branched-chain amino acid transport system permease protein
MDWGSIISNALQSAVGPDAIVFALAAIGLNVHFGYTGLLNFGQAGFMAVAGYGMASIVATFGLSFWLGIAVGLAATVVLALLLGVPTLRLRADYLAIVTIAASEIIRLFLGSVTMSEYFGGRDGLQEFSARSQVLNPFSASGGRRAAHLSRAGRVGCARRLDPGRAELPGRVGVDAEPVGPGTQGDPRRRGRRPAASARTSTPTRCSRSSSAVSSVRSQVSSTPSGQAAINPDNFATDTTFLRIHGPDPRRGPPRVFGRSVGAIIFWGLISLLGGFFDQATNPDHR